MNNTTQQPLKRKWTGPFDKSGKFQRLRVCTGSPEPWLLTNAKSKVHVPANAIMFYMQTCIAKNVVESSSCQHCGGFESAYNLFFICTAYVATRSDLPDYLHEYSLKDLLYGTHHGIGHENETLFLKVQDF